ncbi:hydrogenase maturation nickel metallochaperone HypA [Spongiactinospora sp. TRM90649]|uniref:hydrogenase maturation nickel metallochaperone HypA/HybF n=1 Tax=Spongiactinospora sp. TRM90649 TaxID=3031114 RepID=UPI0023F97C45|nr:hydrogenase maturation nickel metallochaperone HypA [Spongiactinospora sp. TRM90649]MDF5751744.1 hydrogenase maturation nickel metallochaperone HypA [Spongiactinospora sp. TRM90649]
MHEIGLCEGLVELIQQRAEGRRVTSARVRVGARHAVVGEAFDQAFALAAEGTDLTGVVIELVVTPATLECLTCGGRAESADVLAVCPHCASDQVGVRGGDELVLESVCFGEETADVPGHTR